MANSKAVGVAFSDPELSGGTINDTPVGATTASTGAFTTLTASGATTLNGNVACGNAVGDTVAFYGVAGSTQRASAKQAALTLVTANTNGYAFTTAAAFTSFIDQLEEMRATLVALGLMKGSA